MKNCLKFALVLLLATPSVYAKKNRKPTSVERPPQFVLLAFDGSKATDFWKESVDFAETVRTHNEAKNNLVRFTYFVNPVYYVDKTYKDIYTTPMLNKPVSCIGWEDNKARIPVRVQLTNQAFLNGHEIGSHANSHCDQSGTDKGDPMYGNTWDVAAWDSEFSQFNFLFFNIFKNNKISEPKQYAPTGFAFKPENIVGFRAPLLAVTDGLWPVLQKYKFRYDTSKVAAPNYWPQRQNWGGWNFPLARIKIAGTNRTTLSMDYNWLVYHSGGASKPDLTPEDKERFKTQMMDSYNFYFKQNYFGGRAPVNIGHHFSKWNGSAYWDAMKEFTAFVCNKPEVKCVTYSEYADWLDGLDQHTYESYRAGQFDKLQDDNTIKNIAAPFLARVRLDQSDKSFEAVVDPQDVKALKLSKGTVQLQVNFQPQPSNVVNKDELVKKYGVGSTILIRSVLLNKNKKELDWTTYKVEGLGTVSEKVSEPLENLANEPETSHAHTLED